MNQFDLPRNSIPVALLFFDIGVDKFPFIVAAHQLCPYSNATRGNIEVVRSKSDV
ncbi:MAG: hypothetical protein ABW346_02230 [Terrimicrobium sp.]